MGFFKEPCYLMQQIFTRKITNSTRNVYWPLGVLAEITVGCALTVGHISTHIVVMCFIVTVNISVFLTGLVLWDVKIDK